MEGGDLAIWRLAAPVTRTETPASGSARDAPLSCSPRLPPDDGPGLAAASATLLAQVAGHVGVSRVGSPHRGDEDLIHARAVLFFRLLFA